MGRPMSSNIPTCRKSNGLKKLCLHIDSEQWDASNHKHLWDYIILEVKSAVYKDINDKRIKIQPRFKNKSRLCCNFVIPDKFLWSNRLLCRATSRLSWSTQKGTSTALSSRHATAPRDGGGGFFCIGAAAPDRFHFWPPALYAKQVSCTYYPMSGILL